MLKFILTKFVMMKVLKIIYQLLTRILS